MSNASGPECIVQRSSRLLVSVLTVVLRAPTVSFAQDAEALPAAPAAEVSAEVSTEAPATTTMAVPPPAKPEATPVEEPRESAAAAFAKKLTVGVGMRTGLAAQLNKTGDDEVRLSLNDGLVDQVHIRPFMAGALTDHVGFFLQLEIGTPKGLGAFAILDGMAQIKFIDEVQLWVGQHIPANDRNNMNGPFFGNTWNFAITVPSYSFDVGARDRGATLWGLVADGLVKYHLSLVDLQPGRDISQARVAGRLTLNLLDPENYYYASGTYWGGQDTLSIGAVFQHQGGSDVPDPSMPTATVKDNDFTAFSFDAFFEKVLSMGTVTLEGGFWDFENVGKNYKTNQGTADVGSGIVGPLPGLAYMGVVSYLTPKAYGIGKIQANARVQYGDYDAAKQSTIDVGLAYVVDGFNHKYHLNYRHDNLDAAGPGPDIKTDMVQVGVQYMMAN